MKESKVVGPFWIVVEILKISDKVRLALVTCIVSHDVQERFYPLLMAYWYHCEQLQGQGRTIEVLKWWTISWKHQRDPN